PWRELMILWAVLWVGTLYTFYLGLVKKRGPLLATEAVMLVALMFTCAVHSFQCRPQQQISAGQVEGRREFPPPEVGSFDSGSGVAGAKLYTAAAHRSGFSTLGTVYCLNRSTGEKIWEFNDDGDMKQVFSSPVIADGKVYIGEGYHQDKDC